MYEEVEFLGERGSKISQTTVGLLPTLPGGLYTMGDETLEPDCQGGNISSAIY